MARKVSYQPETRKRKVSIEAAGDPISAMDDGSTEQTLKMMDQDHAEGSVDPDTYHLPIDVAKSVDHVLKMGTQIMDEADYQEFLSLDNEGKKAFVEQWNKRRMERFKTRTDFQNDVKAQYESPGM